jgi:cbb3-type cytochrome oxidase subunit 3
MLENKEEADHALNSYFEFNGFESMSLVKNLGSTFIYLLIYFLGIITLLLLIGCKSYANSSNM